MVHLFLEGPTSDTQGTTSEKHTSLDQAPRDEPLPTRGIEHDQFEHNEA